MEIDKRIRIFTADTAPFVWARVNMSTVSDAFVEFMSQEMNAIQGVVAFGETWR